MIFLMDGFFILIKQRTTLREIASVVPFLNEVIIRRAVPSLRAQRGNLMRLRVIMIVTKPRQIAAVAPKVAPSQ